MTILVQSREDAFSIRKKNPDKKIGFVPTMGALHAGHAELLKKARLENDIVVLSIFVNPTQFNNADDFKHYPITLEQDQKIAELEKVDYLWTPAYQDLYPDEYRYQVSENSFSKKLCGQHRPGHFDGVLTVVMRLLNIVKPNKAYFGLKDYQQYQLVKDMVQSFAMDLEVIGVPTVRETSGLAMSSRNLRLTPEQKKLAPLLYKTITESKTSLIAKTQLQSLGFKVDYVEDIKNRRFAAAFLGDVRLIDNVEI